MSLDSPGRTGVPLALRLTLQLEQAWDLLDPDCEPGEPGIPVEVFDQLAAARAAVQAALADLRGPVDAMTEADRVAAGELLAQQTRTSEPDTDYDL